MKLLFEIIEIFSNTHPTSKMPIGLFLKNVAQKTCHITYYFLATLCFTNKKTPSLKSNAILTKIILLSCLRTLSKQVKIKSLLLRLYTKVD